MGLTAEWLTAAAPERDYRARWTLTGLDGTFVRQVLPLAPGSRASDWPADARLIGRARFGVPADLPPGTYALSIVLVDERDQPVGRDAALGPVVITGRERTFDLPAFQTAVGAAFGGELKLWGYSAEQSGDALRLTLVWGALREPRGDYKYFVHLFNPADDFVAAQADAVPRGFTYPTNLWAAGEVVTDVVTLPLAVVPPGSYRLGVGWYDPRAPDLARLPATDASGQPLPADRAVLPLIVER